jgi:hypothetical protein
MITSRVMPVPLPHRRVANPPRAPTFTTLPGPWPVATVLDGDGPRGTAATPRWARAGPDRSAIHSTIAAKDRAPHSIAQTAADSSGVKR